MAAVIFTHSVRKKERNVAAANELAQFLQDVMRDRKFESKRAFAAFLKIAPSTLDRLLEGDPGVKASTLRKIAKTLNVPAESLYSLAGLIGHESIPLTPRHSRLLSIFDRLPNEDQDELIELANLKLQRRKKQNQTEHQQDE